MLKLTGLPQKKIEKKLGIYDKLITLVSCFEHLYPILPITTTPFAPTENSILSTLPLEYSQVLMS